MDGQWIAGDAKADVRRAAPRGAPAARGTPDEGGAHARERPPAEHARGAELRILAAVARAIRVRRIRGAHPLPDVPCHVERSVGARAMGVLGDDGRRSQLRPTREVCARPVRLALAPRVEPAVRAARALLPLGLGRQAGAGEAAVGARVEPVDVGDRMPVEAVGDRALQPSAAAPGDPSLARSRGTARSSPGWLPARTRPRGRRAAAPRPGGRRRARVARRCRAGRRPPVRRPERDRARDERPARTRGGSRRSGRRLPGASRAGRSSESHPGRGCTPPAHDARPGRRSSSRPSSTSYGILAIRARRPLPGVAGEVERAERARAVRVETHGRRPGAREGGALDGRRLIAPRPRAIVVTARGPLPLGLGREEPPAQAQNARASSHET